MPGLVAPGLDTRGDHARCGHQQECVQPQLQCYFLLQVREALLFSAALRLTADNLDKETINKFVVSDWCHTCTPQGGATHIRKHLDMKQHSCWPLHQYSDPENPNMIGAPRRTR